ncbi:MAG: D-hexose-6-phosphate mutarotase [Phycisphaerae bacterium]
MPTPADLAEKFALPDHVSFEPGSGGLTRAVLKTARAEVHVYTYGAHVTHFALAGQAPVLFMSAASAFSPGKPIRGGVPICFPWFGPRAKDPLAATGGASPMHGFARLTEWEVESTSALSNNVTITLVLRATEATRALWPHEFTARYTVTLAGDTLDLALSVVNGDDQPIEYEEALHTYFAVADVRQIRIEGLDGRTFIDKTDALARKPQAGDVTITAETDRVYLDTQRALTIHDPGHNRRIVNAKGSSDVTVVWNPWTAKAKAMADFGDDEWPAMVCVETCNVGDHKVKLPPGGVHHTRATIGVEAS